jgi:signal transduction histidine kinase
LVVPLVLRGRAYGALVAVGRRDGEPRFSVEDEELLEALAACAATAVATAPMRDATRRRNRLAEEEVERTRWARRLQNGTLRGLGALRMSLAAMEGADPAAAHELVQVAIEDVESETEKLQALIADLRPAVLDQRGLGAAIEALANRLEVPELEIRTWVDLSFEEGRAGGRLDAEVETAAYRIVQEALDNAVKHAEASQVLIEVVEDDELEEVRVEIEDNGDGFDPAEEREGAGLAAMCERVELLGGAIGIRSFPGQGTRITATLPPKRQERSMLNIN